MYKAVGSAKYTELMNEYIALFEEEDDYKKPEAVYAMYLGFDTLDNMDRKEVVLFRGRFYQECIKMFKIPQIRQMVSDWLAQQEENRRKSKEASELDDILDALI